MHHSIEIIAILILVASLTAVLFSRLKQQPMIGYVLAGILLGPQVFAVVPNEKEIAFLAELGVILLLFILGIHLPLESFKKTYKAALTVTLALIAGSLALTFGLGSLLGWTAAESVVYGFVVSLSSTAVGVKLLEQLEITQYESGQIALSVLIAQDLVFVPMIIIVNSLGGSGGFDLMVLPRLGIALGALIGLILYLSHKGRVHLLFEEWVERHEDLIPVAALAWCFVGAAGTELLGLSPAFGAFLAGLIIGNSYSEDKVLAKVEPMQSVLLMVFFVSIGMLIQLDVIWNNAATVLSLVFAAMVAKSALCFVLLRRLLPANRWACSYITGLTISQIGEFSFVVATTALTAGVISDASNKILIAVIALSLAFSPIWLSILRPLVKRNVKSVESIPDAELAPA